MGRISEERAAFVCGSKRRYRSRSEAKRAINELKRRKKYGVKLQMFPCSVCNGYHLTKKRIPVRARR